MPITVQRCVGSLRWAAERQSMARVRSTWVKCALALPGAVQAAFPREPVAPQLPRLVERAPRSAGWLYEIKWDGYRIMVERDADSVAVRSRNLHDWTKKLEWLAGAVTALPVRACLLDGEVISGAGRKDDFGALQGAISRGTGDGLTYVVFDLLHIDGVDLRGVPLLQRRELLAALMAKPPARLSLSTHVDGHVDEANALTRSGGYEGIVCKRADALYVSGRSDDWRKVKHVATEEMAVVGYIRTGGRAAGADVLLLAKHTPAGWEYAGQVKGIGLEASREAMRLIGDRGGREPTVTVPPTKARALARDGAQWFAPLFVIEVYSRGSTASRLRQPTFARFRPDREPQ